MCYLSDIQTLQTLQESLMSIKGVHNCQIIHSYLDNSAPYYTFSSFDLLLNCMAGVWVELLITGAESGAWFIIIITPQ